MTAQPEFFGPSNDVTLYIYTQDIYCFMHDAGSGDIDGTFLTIFFFKKRYHVESHLRSNELHVTGFLSRENTTAIKNINERNYLMCR